MCRYWYGYLGGDVLDPARYAKLAVQDPSLSCNGGHTLCAIFAVCNPLNPSKPLNISTNIQSYIPVSTGSLAGCFPISPDEAYVCSKTP